MSNVHVFNFESHKPPTTTESKRDNWVEFGDDNDYFQYLIDRYNNSTTNSAVINAITKLIYGRGLDATDSNKKPNEYAQMKMLFRPEVLNCVITDYKLLGQGYFQLIYNKAKNAIVRVEHIPAQLLRAEKCNDKGEIEAYYYSDNWQEIKKFPPKRIPAFGFGDQTLELLCVRDYSVGQKYYSNVDYIGAIPYAKLEEEVADFLINDVQHGFSPTSVINFNNGVPDEEKQSLIASDVKRKLTGSNGAKVVVAFNSDETKKTTIDSVPLNDAPAHYQYLSEEARGKILLGHSVTSGLLFGVPSNNGFSSNADELKNASILFDNMVIRPYQQIVIVALNKILSFNSIALNLIFIPLQPLDAQGELTDTGAGNDIIEALNSLSPLVATKVLESMTPNEIRNLILLPPKQEGTDLPTALQMSSHIDKLNVEEFGAEMNPDEWELIDARPVSYEDEERLDAELEALNNPSKSIMSKVWEFVTTGVARPDLKSEQDGQLFASRYRYTGEISSDSREFCQKMIKANKLYRKEDIIRMGEKPNTNPGFGPKGVDTYDIFLYKGGGACHHFWTRETYKRFIDPRRKGAEKITPAEARKAGEILPNPFDKSDGKGYRKDNNLVYKAPIDMPNKGFLPK
jgi:hypothetical protein